MSKKSQLMSYAEFGKLVGVSYQRIGQAVRAGKLTMRKVKGKPKIDPKISEKEWAENLDASRRARLNKKTMKVVAPKKFDGQTMHDAELKEKVYRAKLAETKYLEQAGQLISADLVKRQAFEIARKTRDSVMTMPARIAHSIAAETDPHKVEVELLKELSKCLEQLIKESENEKT